MLINSELNENNGFACIEPNFAVVNDGKETLNQYEAKYSALNNNITYIWGPPGTGKTTVIGNIIKQLYKADRSVLIVSHTNTAVDGAIEKVQDLRRGDDSCPVLRLGIPQRKLSPVVELKNHIRLLGVELFKRQEELKFLRLEKNTRVSVVDMILSKFDWIKASRIKQIEVEIEKLDNLFKEKNTAFSEYESAHEQLKRFKGDNPEIKKLTELRRSKDKLQKKLGILEENYANVEKFIEENSSKTQQAEEELSKHKAHASLLSQLDEMLPASFLRSKIEEQETEISSLLTELDQVKSQRQIYEQTIVQGKRNSITAFFSRKSIQQAEIVLPDIISKLQMLEMSVDIAQNTRISYEQQLVRLAGLQRRIQDVTPSSSRDYWDGLLTKTLKEYTDAVREKKTLTQQIEVMKEGKKELDDAISVLRPISKEMFRLVKLSSDKKGRYLVAEGALSAQSQLCNDMVSREVKMLATFLFESLDTESSLEKRSNDIRRLYDTVFHETSSEDEAILRAEIDLLRAELVDINTELVSIDEQITDLERQAIVQAKIVGATLAKTYLSDLLQEIKFDTVILDEASMASIPALWCASYLAERNIIIVGDFLQLSPIVIADTQMAKQWLGRDIFTVSGIKEKAKDKMTKPENFIMLNDQFRMEKEIADIANLYYGNYGGLKSNDSNPGRMRAREEFFNWFPGDRNSRCVEMVDTSNLHAWVTSIPQGKGHSRLNCFSAVLVVEIAFQWLQQEIKAIQSSKQPLNDPKILIVTPYKPHAERIKQLVKFEYERRALPDDANLINVGTIHSFQGSEADVVIFDLVLDEPHWRANLFMPRDKTNEALLRLLNVAVTRAKFKLCLVGNIKYCRKHAKDNDLGQLLSYLVDNQKFPIIDAKEAFPKLLYSKPRAFIGDVNTNEKHIICREDTFFDYFLEDVHGFKKRLIIYSPFITSNRISLILPDFKDAIASGKRIIIVTKALEERKGRNVRQQYKKMESELTAIGVEILHKKGMHEKLVFVDDSAIWMGSLNALSFSGETGEIMHRHYSREITTEYEKIYNIQYINDAVERKKELNCPICGGEMLLNEGNPSIYWKCSNGDYSRSIDQQYPYDGVLRCKCGGEYSFIMKEQPRWVCQNNPRHYQIVRKSDLRLKRMAEKILALDVVYKYFECSRNPPANEGKSGSRQPKMKSSPKKEEEQLSLLDTKDCICD